MFVEHPRPPESEVHVDRIRSRAEGQLLESNL
jgi:hypothetical protein